MHMLRIVNLIIITVVSMSAPINAYAQIERPAISGVLSSFRNNLTVHQFDNAIQYIDSATLDYYDKLAIDVQQADSNKLSSMSLFRRLMVLSFRHRDTSSLIQNYGGKALLKFAMQHEMISDGNIVGDTIMAITSNGKTAIAVTVLKSDSDTLRLHLVKEQIGWRVSLIEEMEGAASLVKDLQRQSGKGENDFIWELLENMTGVVPDSSIWHKKGR